MTNPRHPAIMSFEKADAIDALLGRVGQLPDLGAFLSEHLLAVLRHQYSDLDIESIEFIRADNCIVNGVETTNSHIVQVQTLSLPFYINAVVTARKERYSLSLHIVLNARFTGNKYDITSDVVVQGQQFLGSVVSSC